MPDEDATSSGQSVWVVPGVAIAIGVVYLIAGFAADDVGFAIGGFAVMAAIAAVLLLVRRRSETVQGVLDRRDERINDIDFRSTAFAGVVLILVVLGAFVVDIARGGDGQPYANLAAVAGVAYLAAMVFHRFRG